MDHTINSTKENLTKRTETAPAAIQCPLCGCTFDKGAKTLCASCPLNYGSCNFEKCPNCGYDIPQGSHLWTLAVKTIERFKKARKQ